MKPVLILTGATALLLSGCVSYKVRDDGTARARIGQTVQVSGVSVTPLEVLEDSRCPTDVQCIWAGRLRLKARVEARGAASEQELTLGEEQQVANGRLTLVDVRPGREQGRNIWTEDYRFGFTYTAAPAK